MLGEKNFKLLLLASVTAEEEDRTSIGILSNHLPYRAIHTGFFFTL